MKRLAREKYPDVIELKLKTSLFQLDSQIQLKMEQKKYVIITNAIEALTKLKAEKRLEGVLFIDKTNGSIKFKAYNRKPRVRLKDRIIRYLEHGWVKESPDRIKVYESLPKNIGTARMMSVLEREAKEVKNALIEYELIEFV